jgi:3-oxoacid CoA-transferase subunit B
VPLTGKAVVSRVFFTDLGVFDVTGPGFAVVEFADSLAYAHVVAKTAAPVTTQREHLRRRPASIGVESTAPFIVASARPRSTVRRQ